MKRQSLHCILPPDLLGRLARASDEAVRTRRGGLAGIPMRGEIETSELAPQQAKLAEEALDRLPVGGPPKPPKHPDGFQYEIAFSPADGATRSIVIDEAEVSDALRPVIETAMGHATLG